MAGSSIRFKIPRTNTPSGRALWQQAQAGMAPILENLRIFVRHMEDRVVPEAVEEALRPTLALSNTYAPKDTHTMVNSSYVEVRKRGGNTHVEIGYNRRGEAPYTIFVHEMPQFYHAPPTQYKFLQRAMDEEQGAIIGRIFQSVKARSGL